jgi:hypothetical protein
MLKSKHMNNKTLKRRRPIYEGVVRVDSADRVKEY